MKKKNELNIPNEFSVPEEFSKPREEGQYRRGEFGTELKSEPGIDQKLEYSEEDETSKASGFPLGKDSREGIDSPGYNRSLWGSQSSEGSGNFGRRYRRMTKFAVSAAIIFLVYPMMDIELFEPFSSAAPIITPVITPSETEDAPPETEEPGESIPGETAEPGESTSETEEPEASSEEATEETSRKAAQGEEQTLIVSGTPMIESVDSEGSIRKLTDMEYQFVFKSDKEIDTGDIDFNGEPDAYERALEYLEAQGVDVSGFYLADTEFAYFGQEESDDLIFIGDRDDLANAYIVQGTLTLHYMETEIYKNFED